MSGVDPAAGTVLGEERDRAIMERLEQIDRHRIGRGFDRTGEIDADLVWMRDRIYEYRSLLSAAREAERALIVGRLHEWAKHADAIAEDSPEDTGEGPHEEELHELAARLRNAGYLVVRIPPCRHAGQSHGRHGLITRTAMCDGEEPIPHGFVNGHFGSFGWIVSCACGSSFHDYSINDDPEQSQWRTHQREHGISDIRRPR